MRRGGRILVILGILLALISGGGVFVIIATATPQDKPPPVTKIVIAFQEIAERTEISPDQVGMVDWPLAIPTPIGAQENPAKIVGQLAKVPIYPQQVILDKMLIDKTTLKETHSNASLVLKEGNVAIALPVTLSSNVAEAIQAGDHVDLIAIFVAQPVAPPGSNVPVSSVPYITAQHLMQDVLVLQVGQWPSPSAKEKAAGPTTVVTLQLPEQDALVLRYAVEYANGGVVLVLRPANDPDLAKTEPVTLEYINKRFEYKFPYTGQ